MPGGPATGWLAAGAGIPGARNRTHGTGACAAGRRCARLRGKNQERLGTRRREHPPASSGRRRHPHGSAHGHAHAVPWSKKCHMPRQHAGIQAIFGGLAQPRHGARPDRTKPCSLPGGGQARCRQAADVQRKTKEPGQTMQKCRHKCRHKCRRNQTANPCKPSSTAFHSIFQSER